MKRRFLYLAYVLILLIVANGCGSLRTAPSRNPNVFLTMMIDSEYPPREGRGELRVLVEWEDGRPVVNADVRVRGDSLDFRIPPVYGQGISDRPGEYRVPFEWADRGEWELTLTVFIGDITVTETYYVTVVS